MFWLHSPPWATLSFQCSHKHPWPEENPGRKHGHSITMPPPPANPRVPTANPGAQPRLKKPMMPWGVAPRHPTSGRGTQNVGILRTSLLLSSLKVSLLTCVSQWAALGSDDTQPIKANQEGMIQPPHCTQEEAGAKTCYGHRAGWGGAETGPHSCPLLWRPVPGEPGPPFTHLRVPGETPHPHS